MKKIALPLLMTLCCAAYGLHAQTQVVAPDPLLAADTLNEKPKLTISGYVDAYYQYNFNKPASGSNTARIFDLPHNQFSLGLVQAVINYSAKRVNVVADLTFGPNAELGNFGNEGTAKIIKQAYIAYEATDKLTFTVGQFGTHIGYELIDAPLNVNYSLSHLFGNGPFYHTGAKLNYQLAKKVGLMFGVVNGWDGLADFNDKKSIVGQLALIPAEGLGVYVNWIGGDEYNTASNFGGSEGSYTSLFDLTTSYQISSALKLGVNAAYGSFATGSAEVDGDDPWSVNASWGGAALYMSYAFNDMVGLGVRGEYFSDPKGVRYYGPAELTALTLTGDIRLSEGRFLLKPELRFDQAQEAFFEGADGGLKKSQTTLGAAFVYAF